MKLKPPIFLLFVLLCLPSVGFAQTDPDESPIYTLTSGLQVVTINHIYHLNPDDEQTTVVMDIELINDGSRYCFNSDEFVAVPYPNEELIYAHDMRPIRDDFFDGRRYPNDDGYCLDRNTDAPSLLSFTIPFETETLTFAFNPVGAPPEVSLILDVSFTLESSDADDLLYVVEHDLDTYLLGDIEIEYPDGTTITLPLETFTVYVTSNGLNIREEPTTTAEVVGSLRYREAVEVIGLSEDEEWYQIEDGYIFAELTSTTRPSAATVAPSTGGSGGTTSQPTSPPAAPAAVCDCSGDTLNCGNFSREADAQACFNYCVSIGRGDIHNLDGDANGRACESLP